MANSYCLRWNSIQFSCWCVLKLFLQWFILPNELLHQAVDNMSADTLMFSLLIFKVHCELYHKVATVEYVVFSLVMIQLRAWKRTQLQFTNATGIWCVFWSCFFCSFLCLTTIPSSEISGTLRRMRVSFLVMADNSPLFQFGILPYYITFHSAA